MSEKIYNATLKRAQLVFSSRSPCPLSAPQGQGGDQSDQMQWRTTRDRLGELAFPVSLSSTCLLSEAHLLASVKRNVYSKSREPSPCPAHSLLSLQCPAESLACPRLEINMF